MTFYITILLSWAKNELEAGWSHFFIGFTGFGFTGEAVMGEALPNGAFFFLERAGEMRINMLRRKKKGERAPKPKSYRGKGSVTHPTL